MTTSHSVVTTARSARAVVRLATWALAAGRPIVLSDGQHADLVLAAHDASPHRVAFVVRHSTGFLTAALPAATCDRLQLPPMPGRDGDPNRPDLRVSVDAIGIGTGISAADRARTLSTLADPATRAVDLCRPGHVVVRAVHADGVLARPGRAEAAVDLARAAGLPPVVAGAELVSAERPFELAGDTEARAFARDHGIVVLDVSDVVERRAAATAGVIRGAAAHVPVPSLAMRAVGYRSTRGTAEHVAMVAGSVRGGEDVPVHIQRECVSGDVFGSSACECRARLDSALTALGERGVLVYVRAEAGVTDCSLLGEGSNGAEADAVAVGIEVLRDLKVRSARPLAGTLGAQALLALGGASHVPDSAWGGGGASPSGRALAAAAGSDYWGVG